jgi:hypothetical protein
MITAQKCAGCETQFVPKNSKNKYCSKECRTGTVSKMAETTEDTTPKFSLVDQSNHLLSIGPTALSCGLIPTDEGPRLLVTVRTPSTTMTVGLTNKEASAWLAEFAYKVRDMQASEESTATEEPS